MIFAAIDNFDDRALFKWFTQSVSMSVLNFHLFIVLQSHAFDSEIHISIALRFVTNVKSCENFMQVNFW